MFLYLERIGLFISLLNLEAGAGAAFSTASRSINA
jgi:hypothetical protein